MKSAVARIVGLAFLLIVLCVVPLAAKAGPISGKEFRAIQAAVSEAQARGLKIDQYEIDVRESGSSLFVSFSDPHRPVLQHGSSPNMPEFNVELNRDDLRALKLTFER